jgi:phage terminase large subunit
MATPLILDYAPRKEFEPFHERRERFACIVTHRRAGKTVACVQELQRVAMQSRNVRPRFA